jgi:cobaltochelatase CobT
MISSLSLRERVRVRAASRHLCAEREFDERIEMTDVQIRSRHQERIEELCASSIRALSGERDLHFRGQRLHRGRRALPLFAPHLHPRLDGDDFETFRGAADGLALRLLNSDPTLHRRLSPDQADSPIERMVFELLEQFRAESMVPVGMLGVRHNLRHCFETWSLAFHHAGKTESARGLLLYTLTQVCRSRVTFDPVVEETEDMLEATRGALAPLIGHDLAGLRRDRHDQAAYAVHALNIARTIAEMLRAGGDESDDEADAAADRIEDDDAWAAFSMLLDNGDSIDQGVATAVSGRSLVLDGDEGGYRVYTRAYDREVDAAALVRTDLLKEFRERLDRRVAGTGINLAHLARDLKALLAVPTRDGWDGAQEEGLIDGRRLAQLIATPNERRLFRIEREEPVADCLVTLLIDCSGSMKEHIESIATLVDVLVRALEQAGAASEVLGFTTNAWNGGRAQRDWLRAGRPPHPGRLNEACHMVFKSADTTWRRARPGIAALLKSELFREGIDGEAVEWAMRRARIDTRNGGRNESRKMLIVISDGSPMDSATQLANDRHYLDHHLKDVVASHEQSGAEIYGLGVGLDLSPYYSRSHVLDLSDGVGTIVFRELLAMIGRGAHR